MGSLMKCVLDTNILIDYLNGVQYSAKEIGIYKTKVISVITHIEILVGAKTSEEESIIRSFLSTFQIQPLSTEIAEEAVRLRKQHCLKIPDAIVYATAKTKGCLLVSRNTKDFKTEWPDIRVPYQI